MLDLISMLRDRIEHARGVLEQLEAFRVKSRRNRIRTRRLTARQEKFLRLITTLPIPSMARAARQAGYSESVARKPKIICESPAVLEAWNRWWNTTFSSV
jgi:hypothetical protein